MAKQAKVKFESFETSSSDPLAPEHALVDAFAREALTGREEYRWHESPELKTTEAGRTILNAEPSAARRLVLAALAQTLHWDVLAQRARAEIPKDDIAQYNPHVIPGWAGAWGRRMQTTNVISTLLRRALPFDEADLIALVSWVAQAEDVSPYWFPLASITKCVERRATSNGLMSAALRDVVTAAVNKLRASRDKEAKRSANRLDELLAANQPVIAPVKPKEVRPVVPGPVGHRAVFTELK